MTVFYEPELNELMDPATQGIVVGLQDQLEQVQMQLLHIANSVHDLGNLITSTMLISHYQQKFVQQKNMEGVLESARVLERNLASIQVLQRTALQLICGKEPGLMLSTCSLPELLGQFVRMMELSYPDHLTFQVQHGFSDSFTTDKDVLFHHVLGNIVKNSADVAKSKGIKCEVCISSYAISDYKAQYPTSLLLDCEPGIVLVIGDNAGGVSSDLAQELGDPFPTHRHTGGTGLGIYALKHCIETWFKGQVWIENRPNSGLFYHIALPNTPLT